MKRLPWRCQLGCGRASVWIWRGRVRCFNCQTSDAERYQMSLDRQADNEELNRRNKNGAY